MTLLEELRVLPFQTMPEMFNWPRYCPPGVYVTEASLNGRTWRPSRDGEHVHCLPVYDGPFPFAESVAEMDLIDILAWRPDGPGRWFHRTGEATLLGRQWLHWSEEDGKALTIHATPLDWLGARGEGVCVLTEMALFEVAHLRRLACPDRRLANRLYGTLHQRLVPEILVPEARAA